MPVGIAKVTQAFGESYKFTAIKRICDSHLAFQEVDDLQQVHQRGFQ